MSDFPTLSRDPAKVIKQILSAVHKEESASKYTMITRTGTRIPKKWQVEYTNTSFLSITDRALLEAHYEENMGLNFSWTNPDDDVVYRVFYDMDFLKITEVGVLGTGYYETILVFNGSPLVTTTTTTTTTSSSSTTTTT